MTDKEQKAAAKTFCQAWQNRGDEKSDTQSFWLELLGSVLGMATPTSVIVFEKRVTVDGTTRFIDAYIPATRVLVEQKSEYKHLERSHRQSDDRELTAYGQAKRYDDNLPLSEKARWIVTCNFRQFLVYDMERPGTPPERILLEDLPKEHWRLAFLVDNASQGPLKENKLSLEAGQVVGKLYDGLLASYGNDTPATLRSLNMLCVRLVFCLYAENAGLFGAHTAFHDYLARFEARDIRSALLRLFEVLDTSREKRDPYLEPELAAFPYVNGGLFKEREALVPPFTPELKTLLLENASGDFDWSGISPTIFGSVFEATLNPENRRAAGMHYTSVENIHKVIDPLFLDRLHDELEAIRAKRPAGFGWEKGKLTRESKEYRDALLAFQDKLASMTFADPACGSGNFLTETYISLRRLENEVLAELVQRNKNIDLGDSGNTTIKVSLSQFRGFEINDYAVAVARTALWIAESQMFNETLELLSCNGTYLPLKAYSGIQEGNALQMDWRLLLKDCHASGDIYLISNPPFIGARMMNAEQKQDLLDVFGPRWRNLGNLDYVCGWYRKAAELMRGTAIRAAFVSTNSICQGGQVADLWQGLIKDFGIHIDFAHRTFRWDSESKGMAHVHCVIVGFSTAPNPAPPIIFDNGVRTECRHINPYLIDAEDVFIESRQHPRCDVPEIGIGNKPIDDGNYLFTEAEKLGFLKYEPAAAQYFHPWYGSDEFINNRPRWCLWLGDCTPAQLRSMPHCMEKVAKVREFRLASKSEGTRKLAERPTRFHVENMPKGNCILIPKVSSEKRIYIPIGFMQPGVLCSDLVFIIPNATLYHFGVLTSLVHNAWTRVVCGRLEMRYRYSKDIVYNNFPWPNVTEAQKAVIAANAQAILDARAKYPDSSLADLYDPLVMPQELRAAHHRNDHDVLAAYGMSPAMTEAEIVAALFKM